MKQLREVFSEYGRMRENGLDAKSVLHMLRPYIEALPKAQRDDLANMLRAWESTHQDAPEAPPAAPKINRITGTNSTMQATPAAPITPPASSAYNSMPDWLNTPAAPPTQAYAPPPPPAAPAIKPLRPASSTPAAKGEWANCGHCGKPNQKQEVFCFACGQLLESPPSSQDTKPLQDKSAAPLDSEYFGNESVLVLRVRGSTDMQEIRPQKLDHEIVLGRSTKGSAMSPDVDLEGKRGSDLGVSRMHLSIRYDKEGNVLMVSDMGSANGSFINGQRLVPRELRVLRHGDELRLGRMVMNVSFRHPGGR